MEWKKQLKFFENQQEWDAALALLQKIIAQDAHNMNAYIAILFLLMNLLVEENYDELKHDHYAHLLKSFLIYHI